MSVLAYFITWTTYGTWLPGDARGWIKTREWGIKPSDPELENKARARMAEPAVVLTPNKRKLIEQTITDHCRIRRWILHAVNARTNHVHVVVTVDRDADEIRNQFKAWCSRKLSDQAKLTNAVAKKAGRRHWFTEGGDSEAVYDEQHLENVILYVMEGQ
jgi:REP element-mobilizing transposase RayT